LTLIIVAAARVICLNAQWQPVHQHAQCISFSEPRPGIADYIGVLNFTGNMADVEQTSVSRTASRCCPTVADRVAVAAFIAGLHVAMHLVESS